MLSYNILNFATKLEMAETGTKPGISAVASSEQTILELSYVRL